MRRLSWNSVVVQFSPIIRLYLGSIGMDCVLSKSCYKGTILQRNYRKITILWSFSYNFYVKLHVKKLWDPQHDGVIPKAVASKYMGESFQDYS